MIVGLSIVSTVIYAIVKAIEEISQVKVPWRSGVIGSDLISISTNLTSFNDKCLNFVDKKIADTKPEIVVIPPSDSGILQTNGRKDSSSDLELEVVVINDQVPNAN